MAERAERILAIEPRSGRATAFYSMLVPLGAHVTPFFPFGAHIRINGRSMFFLESPFIANGKRQ